MNTRVSPTRMHLLELKKRHAVAVRGHKLLKDKLDELMKQFLELVKRDRELREEVDEKLGEAFRGFLIARGAMSSNSVDAALMYPKERVALKASRRHIMNVEVPKFEWSLRDKKTGPIYIPTGLHTPRPNSTRPSGFFQRPCRASWSWLKSKSQWSFWLARSKGREDV